MEKARFVLMIKVKHVICLQYTATSTVVRLNRYNNKITSLYLHVYKFKNIVWVHSLELKYAILHFLLLNKQNLLHSAKTEYLYKVTSLSKFLMLCYWIKSYHLWWNVSNYNDEMCHVNLLLSRSRNTPIGSILPQAFLNETESFDDARKMCINLINTSKIEQGWVLDVFLRRVVIYLYFFYYEVKDYCKS